ncbi:MAG: LptA/OstA family protein [Treponema sp.]|nr:LptA/OstA family protein [Treponema sp.]
MKRLISIILLFTIYTAAWATDDFSFYGDTLSSNRGKGKEHTSLQGNAGITSSSTNIKADSIEIYGSDNEFAECTDNVEVIDNQKGISLKAEKLFFNRKDDIIRVEGSAVMEDKKNEVIVKGNFLEYMGKDETCLIQIGVRILKDDMVCRGEFAKYNRNDDILELTGMPVVFWKNDEYRALRILIDLDKDEITLEGKVSGSIFSEDKTEENKLAEEESSTEEKSEEK